MRKAVDAVADALIWLVVFGLLAGMVAGMWSDWTWYR